MEKIIIMEASSCELISDATQDSYEMMYLENQEDREQIPPLAKHPLLITSATSPIPHCIPDPLASVKVGAFYEINHSKLPPKTPEQLKCIRVVMVSEKSALNVSLRFPSIHCLRMHNSDKNYGKPEGKTLPSLDEKYVIGSDVAADVLFRRIPPQEIAENRDLWSFWAAPMAPERRSSTERGGVVLSNVVSKNGTCWSQLRFAGLVQWGKRRQVRFFNPQEECKQGPLSSIDKKEGENKEDDICHYDEEEEEKETEEGGEENMRDNAEPFEVESHNGCKRKLCGRNKRTQTQKRAKRLKPSQNIVDFRSKKKTVKNSIERWSAARYKLAEENMLKIMKAKGAIFGKPILRPALRSEARKLIGDTGLLDHLLKHMAGKVAPGGTHRFRRRHNAEGAMEYWLESADLVNVRREAGVQDPYWTPPPGWTPGDNPTQDPLCARALKELREEMANMKKDVQQLMTKSREEDLAVVTAANSMVINLQSGEEGFLIQLKEMYIELANRKAKIEDQMKEIAQSLIEMEEQMMILKSRHYEPMPSELEALPPLMGSPTTPSDTERDIKKMGQMSNSAMISGEKQENNHKRDKAAATAIEDKAARIQRLKSGFRICKPQGTFLWPNVTISPKPGFQQDDPFVVPTPPSASSSTTTSVSHLLHVPQYGTHPFSPVKPLAEKRPFKAATLCTVTNSDPLAPPLETHKSQSMNIKININTSLDLNEAPKDQNGDNILCGTLTYQRKHHNVAKIHSLLSSVATKGDKEQQESVIRYCEQQQQKECPSSFSQLPAEGEASWLELAFKYDSPLKASNGS